MGEFQMVRSYYFDGSIGDKLLDSRIMDVQSPSNIQLPQVDTMPRRPLIIAIIIITITIIAAGTIATKIY